MAGVYNDDGSLRTNGGSSGSGSGLTDTQLRATPVQVTDTNATNQNAQLGGVTETAPASDTASSGINGRLQRIAQRLTSLIALLPTALGQGTMAQSLKVVVASDQSAVKTILDASATTGGVTGAKVLSAASTNATNVKASAGRIYSCQFSNSSASYRYVKFYNLTTAPTVGTSTVLSIVGVPPGGRASLTAPQGIYCSAGIAYSIVAGAADNDTTAVGANEIAGSITYL